jgi:hypothetical protein
MTACELLALLDKIDSCLKFKKMEYTQSFSTSGIDYDLENGCFIDIVIISNRKTTVSCFNPLIGYSIEIVEIEDLYKILPD